MTTMNRTNDEEWYLILAPHRTDLYWRHDACGYGNLADAGLYKINERFNGLESDRGDRKIPLMSKKNEIIELRAQKRKEIDNLTIMLRILCKLKGSKD